MLDNNRGPMSAGGFDGYRHRRREMEAGNGYATYSSGGGDITQHSGSVYSEDPHPPASAGWGNGRFLVPPGRVADGTRESGRYVPWSATYQEPTGYSYRYSDRKLPIPPDVESRAPPHPSGTGAPVNLFYRGDAQFRRAENNPYIPPSIRQDEQTDAIYNAAVKADKAHQVDTRPEFDKIAAERLDVPQLGRDAILGDPWGRVAGDSQAEARARHDRGRIVNAPSAGPVFNQEVATTGYEARATVEQPPPYATRKDESFRSTGEGKELQVPLQDLNTVESNRTAGRGDPSRRRRRLSTYQKFVKLFAARHRGRLRGKELLSAAAKEWRRR